MQNVDVYDAISSRSNRRRTLPQHVIMQISELVDKNELQPGDQLPSETQLMEHFGVSRNVIREAVASLKSAGVLEIRRGLGTFVNKKSIYRGFKVQPHDLLDMENLKHIYDLRVEIESGAAAIAANARTKEQVERLEQALMRVNQGARNWQQGAQSAIDFHLTIADATNNPHFKQLMTYLHEVIHKGIRTLRYKADGSERALQIEHEHREIFIAIKSKKPSDARNAMRKHLQNAINHYQLGPSKMQINK